MKILGNSFQETEPTPDKPTEIKNENYIFVNINGQPIKYKSNLIIGNLAINNTKHFNWFHKLMWKLLLGIKIENIEEDKQ
jgi:hypothetical protein